MYRKIMYSFILIISLFVFIFVLASCDNITNNNSGGTKVKYTVSFNSNGGTVIDSQLVESGDRIKKPADPNKNGCTFVKWTFSGEEWSFIKDFVTGDMTLDANWEINKYDVVLNTNNSVAGTVNGSGSFQYDSKVTISAKTNAGYSFDGWYNGDNQVSSQEKYTFNMPSENIIYMAKWVINTNTPYKVEHYLQNDDGNYYEIPNETDNLFGTTGTQTKGEAKTYEGFSSPEIIQESIKGDGSTVLKLYYTRNVLKIGFIFLHDEKSTYDKNFIDAAKDVCNELKVQAVLKVNVPEGEECYSAAKELVNKGCKGVFADSFGHEDHMIRAAKEFPNVQFAHATGTKAHTEKLDNFHNAFASIYEGRYIAGVAAGMKLNEMIKAGKITAAEAKMGYVGTFPYAEVVSGYTSFYLGAKSVCEYATMTVRYTNSWYDETAEAATCRTLIDTDKCVLISQHADSQGAPSVCNNMKVPNVFYNGANTALEDSYLTSSRINWRPFFKYFIQNILAGISMPYDWIGTLANGGVEVYPASSIAAEGTQAKMDQVKAAFIADTLDVFDCNTFTVNGEKVTLYLADVDTDYNYTPDTQVIENGVFLESIFRSAPYFDLRIDGITEILSS